MAQDSYRGSSSKSQFSAVARVAAGDIIVAVAASGGSDDSTTRPAQLSKGDYSSVPFATLAAAVRALPQVVPYPHKVVLAVEDGDIVGAVFEGIKSWSRFVPHGPNNYGYTDYGFRVVGTMNAIAPSTGSATGTATGGSSTSITKTGAGWTVSDPEMRGRYVRLTGGTGVSDVDNYDNIGIILDNTADTITVWGFDYAFSFPTSGTTFEIVDVATHLETYETSNGDDNSEFIGCSGMSVECVKPIEGSNGNATGFSFETCNMFQLKNCVVDSEAASSQAQFSVNHSTSFLGTQLSMRDRAVPFYASHSLQVILQVCVVTACNRVWFINTTSPQILGLDFKDSTGISCRFENIRLAFFQFSNDNDRLGASSSMLDAWGCEYAQLSFCTGSGNAGYGMTASGGGYIALDPDTFTVDGSAGEMLIDGSPEDYASLNSYDTVIGSITAVSKTENP